MTRLPIVGVMGSANQEHRDLAEPLGRLLARRGCHLLTGGRGGAMEAVSRAFCAVDERPGRTIAVLPDRSEANPFVEIPIYTQLSAENNPRSPEWRWSRNHINVRTSTVVIALPGGPGTASELALAAHGPHRRPCLAFLGGTGQITGLVRDADGPRLSMEGGALVDLATTITEVDAFLDQHLGPPAPP